MNTSQKSSSPGKQLVLSNLLIRAPNPNEFNLIKASWFTSYARNSPSRGIRRDIFDREQNNLISRLLDLHPPIVVCFPAVPDEVIAWACRDQDTVQYVYTKHDFRRQRLASLLIFGAKFYTHETKAGSKLFTRSGMLFNPYKAGLT